ncbi:MAG: TetR/AcrR family transcriptional regulator [Deltaproteobacteria bacterium]|nr:TetR/AcrR family transcriptional regulator [Deltaproteobacteria bacterium]
MDDYRSFTEFSKSVTLSRQDICRKVYKDHRQTIRIKKEKTLVKNLMGIFDAALKISNEKGFQAMTMRNLSEETGLSMGGLYAYFSGKEDLLDMLLSTGHTTTRQILGECLAHITDPVSKLRVAIRTHLFLSEAMQPWFYFSYMEARHLGVTQKERAKAGELETEKLFADIIEEGRVRGLFAVRDSLLMASLVKAMVQDWYVKRWKYAKRNVTVDQYATLVIAFVEAFCLKTE